MSRRPTGRQRLAALVAAASLAGLGGLLLASGSAGAATTVKAQLSLTGIATADNPTGGSVVGIHPGDTVSISSSLAPTAGLDKLGLSDLLSGLLNNLATYQVKVDFSHLPGGANNTVLTGKDVKSFTFPKVGTYDFTWSAQTIGLLNDVVPLQLDGNQLAAAGVKLNAQNQYVGQIVVANDPPKGGIGVQLPGVSVQPSLPVVGTLPKISLPGVTTPTIPVSVPDLNPTKSAAPSTTTTKPSTSTSANQGPVSVLPVPAMVVPHSGGQLLAGSNDGADTSSGGGTSDVVPVDVAPIPGTTSKSTASAASAERPAAKNTKIDAGTYNPTSSGLPVILAVVAMLALVLVAGTYARLFLIRKQS